MAKQTINLGALADGSDGDTNRTAWGKANSNFDELYADGSVTTARIADDAVTTAKLSAEVLGLLASPGSIEGLKIKWNSGTSVTISEGWAYIPGAGEALQIAAPVTLSGLSLSASTWYHLYLYDNAGTPTIECVTTAPATAYYGTARAKTGDTSRRYIGSVRTDASGNIYPFDQVGTRVRWMASINGSDFYVLSAGSATTPTDVSCASSVPATAELAEIIATNDHASVAVVIGTSDMGYTLSASVWPMLINPVQEVYATISLNSSQVFKYMYRSAASSSFAVRVAGYVFER